MKGTFPIHKFRELRTPFYYYDTKVLRDTLSCIRTEAARYGNYSTRFPKRPEKRWHKWHKGAESPLRASQWRPQQAVLAENRLRASPHLSDAEQMVWARLVNDTKPGQRVHRDAPGHDGLVLPACCNGPGAGR